MRAFSETRSQTPTITIIVPARNEARNLEIVLPQLPDAHEIIVVDGHSSDDTEAVVRRHRPTAEFIQQSRKGKGNALACGFEAASGDVIVMFDADGSADPAEIDLYLAALLSGADFAKGSRVLASGGSEDITPVRDLGNRMLTLLTNTLFKTRYTDLCYGYNAFWRDILPKLSIPSSTHADAQWGDGFEIETMINCRVASGGLQIHEVPSVELERIHGESNLNTFRDGFRVLRTIMIERLRRRGASSVMVPAADVSVEAVLDVSALELRAEGLALDSPIRAHELHAHELHGHGAQIFELHDGDSLEHQDLRQRDSA